MKILVTAFEPFDNERINPSQAALQLIPETIHQAKIAKFVVPVVFQKSIDLVIDEINREKPDVVLCIGQAGGRTSITPERIAINIDDARIPDNEGNQPIDKKIVEDGPVAYFSTLPVKAMVERIQQRKLPASLSNTAGTFVCNHLMYGILHYLNNHQPHVRSGFMHIPYATEQVKDKKDTFALSLNKLVEGIQAAIEAIIDYDQDIQSIQGTLH